MSGHYRKEHNCLNCERHVDEHYCSRCGQPNLELKESFWHFIGHSIGHYFHFDNKFFQTLKPLLIKPGQVTLDYLAGKRARYINPVSMYILVSIVYFLVVYSPEKHEKDDDKVVTKNEQTAGKEVNNAMRQIGLTNSTLTAKAQQAIRKGYNKSSFRDLSFERQTLVLDSLNQEYKKNKADSVKETLESFTQIHDDRNDSTYEAYLVRQKKLPILNRDGWYVRMMRKREIEYDGVKAAAISEQLEHYRPKQYFLLMPLLALFIMWNFRKNHIYYLDHLIFTVHGMTVFFLISILTQPLKKYVFGEDSFLGTIISLGVIIWLFWYGYQALKIFYQRTKKQTIFKMLTIFVMYYIAFSISETIVRNMIYYLAV
ncbi:DUF3667 domain-containing protein [Pedobacter sp. HMF7647]|uniref:DUF3667 domain-containing protein n=1 Tax=Hufsiella arboris TaxID=2695275 RepID=A0A7K1Y918_9SPHI|nr:DUF3667 domain-containing protein [Hufsiella arboris]MXV50528.1 DUF3667 domain-containing protein [Hufsiella arboris]